MHQQMEAAVDDGRLPRNVPVVILAQHDKDEMDAEVAPLRSLRALLTTPSIPLLRVFSFSRAHTHSLGRSPSAINYPPPFLPPPSLARAADPPRALAPPISPSFCLLPTVRRTWQRRSIVCGCDIRRGRGGFRGGWGGREGGLGLCM
jgi:hypothetical protein